MHVKLLHSNHRHEVSLNFVCSALRIFFQDFYSPTNVIIYYSFETFLDMNTLLERVLKANIYIEPVLFILILSIHIINIRILSSRELRAFPCIYYFLGYSAATIVYTSLLAPTQILRAVSIGWENTRIGCHIYFFVIFLGPYVARAMLILAAFDRYYCSSQPRLMSWKQAKRKARKYILIMVIIISIYLSPMCFIYYFDTTTGLCLQYRNLPAKIYIFTQAILSICAPTVMFILGILTSINTHRVILRLAQQKVSMPSRLMHRQLNRMLLLHMCVHIILTTPFGVIYFMNAFIESTRTPSIFALRYVFVFLSQTDYVVSFFLYILLGSFYRQRFCKLLKCFRENRYRIRSFQYQQPRSTKKFIRTVVLETL